MKDKAIFAIALCALTLPLFLGATANLSAESTSSERAFQTRMQQKQSSLGSMEQDRSQILALQSVPGHSRRTDENILMPSESGYYERLEGRLGAFVNNTLSKPVNGRYATSRPDMMYLLQPELRSCDPVCEEHD